MMELPEIKDISREEIVNLIKALAPFFVPEWQPQDEEDLGMVLARVFGEMYLSLVNRLNRTLLRHYLNYLDKLEIGLLPPQSAEAPLVFVPVSGSSDEILVPSSTKVAGKDQQGENVIFETQQSFVVSPAKLKRIFTVEPSTDSIVDQSLLIDGQDSEMLFGGENIQKHVFYIGESRMLNIKKAAVKLLLWSNSTQVLADEQKVLWEYFCQEQGRWQRFSSVRLAGNEIVLLKETDSPIGETEIEGTKSRWIRCRVVSENPAEEVGSLEIENIVLAVSPVGGIEIPVRQVQGIGDIYAKRLQEKNIKTVGELLWYSAEELSRILQCGTYRAENILEAARKAFYDKTGSSLDVVEMDAGILPEYVYYNDVALDPKNFKPFGTKPMAYDACYIGSEEVFSKKGYDIQVSFDYIAGDFAKAKPELSWEYWDGQGWSKLKINGLQCSTKRVEIVIQDLPEIKRTKVNGKESCWIRVRLLDSIYKGEYALNDKGQVSLMICHPPQVLGLRLSYRPASKGYVIPERILIENNLNIKEIDPNKIFRPFEFIPDRAPGIYIALDRPLCKGPYSIYFGIDRYYNYPQEALPPRIKWQCYCGEGTWKDISVLDNTRGLTRAGSLMLYLPEETSRADFFGLAETYWIRAVVEEARWQVAALQQSGPEELFQIEDNTGPFYLRVYRMVKETSGETGSDDSSRVSEKKDIPGCEQTVVKLIRDIAKVRIEELPPVLRGVYINGITVLQVETITDEVLGSGTVQAGLCFKTTKAPVLEEEVWVNEFSGLSEQERSALAELDTTIQEYDSEGNLVGLWIRWSPVDSFLDSGPEDRHYRIDRITGQVYFGDGINGKVPPAGTDNIKISYKTGGGSRGNLPAGQIKDLYSAVSSIDRVYNPMASSGGCDMEAMDSLLARGARVVRHRNRAVSVQDYQDIVLEASRSIAKVKVLPETNDCFKYSPAEVAIVVVPFGETDRPLASPVLKKQIKKYVSQRAPGWVKVHVVDPLYIKMNVDVEVYTCQIDKTATIEQSIMARLKEFLNPITGGPGAQGWDFGTLPCMSDVYALVQGIEGLEYVAQIRVVLMAEDYVVVLNEVAGVNVLPEFSLIYPGDIDVKVRLTDSGGKVGYSEVRT